MKNLSIRIKILVVFLIVSIIAVVVNALIGYKVGKASLEEESFNKLRAVREMKARQVEDYFQQIRDQVITFSEDRMIIDAMKAFKSGFSNIEFELNPNEAELTKIDNSLARYYDTEFLPRLQSNLDEKISSSNYRPTALNSKILQDLYIASNPNDVGSKHNLVDAKDGSTFSTAHALYHPIIENFLTRFGYYDIFLVDNETGNIVYSVFKEVDFGISLIDGPYKNTNIARACLAACRTENPSFVILEDYGPYDPSYNAQASFIASPIFEGDRMIGVLVFQMPVDKINDIMTDNHNWSSVGLGQSGETYIVGSDNSLRNQSRFLIEDSTNYFRMITGIGVAPELISKIRNLNSTIGLQKVDTEGTKKALKGQTGELIFDDYRGVSVLSSYKPLKIQDVKWVIMSEINESEAFANIARFKKNILYAILTLIAIVAGVSYFFARSLTLPIKRLTENAAELAGGNLNTPIKSDRGDEIGQLGRSFETMRTNIKELVDDLNDLNANLEERVEARTMALEKANARIESIINNASDAIITINSEYNIELFNPAAENTFGYKKDEIIGRSLNVLLDKESATKHNHYIHKFSEEKPNSRHMENRSSVVGKKMDGTLFPVEAGISKMMIEGKMYFTAFLRDISERKKAEEKIRNQKDMLEEAFATIKIQKDRMERELNIGREIQMNMLPLIFPAFPERNEIDLFAKLIPAMEVGGDFYDFYFLDEHHICFCVGDVSDKGVPAALFMAVSKTLIKSRASDDHSPASIVTHINNELSRDNNSNMFVTLFLGILNTRTGNLTYTNAGHNRPYILKSGGELITLKDLHGVVAGVIKGITYTESTVQLEPDDYFISFTDGVTEAMNAQRKLYDEERLEKFITDKNYSNCTDFIDRLLHELEEHKGSAEQTDDITILAMKYRGMLDYQKVASMDLKINNMIEEIPSVNQRFLEFADKNSIPEKITLKYNLVFDELLNNVITYAFKDKKVHIIEIKVDYYGDRLSVTIEDDGIPFNPFEEKSPDTSLPIEERSLGGLGIHLVRNMMDEVHYQRRINQNVVSLSMKIKD